MRIEFSRPITYEKENKTGSERALEWVEEYFYLGGKFRVSIFEEKPGGESSRLYAMGNRLDCHRSWTNVAIKVVSYCTVVLPLVALMVKAALRYYLGISSVEIGKTKWSPSLENIEEEPLQIREAPRKPSSTMQKKLNSDLVELFIPFLKESDQESLAQTCRFMYHRVRAVQEDYIEGIEPLKTKLEALPERLVLPASSSEQDIVAAVEVNQAFGELLVTFIASRSLGYPKYWASLMKAFIEKCDYEGRIDLFIAVHAILAALLEQSKEPISSDQIYHFCRYLGSDGYLKLKCRPWIVYRVLEQYSRKLNHYAESINRAIKESLALHAKTGLIVKEHINAQFLGSSRNISLREIDIDPRNWFGLQGSRYSLWDSLDFEGENNQSVSMPDLFEDVLFESIVSIRDSRLDLPFVVGMRGRAGSEVPRNFVLSLARRITNEGIFLESDDKVHSSQLQRPEFLRSIYSLSSEELEALASQYPAFLNLE